MGIVERGSGLCPAEAGIKFLLPFLQKKEGRSDTVENSMKVAFCGIVAALSAVLMFLTGLVPVATLAIPAIAGCLLIPVVVESGLSWGFGVYAVCSVLLIPACS